MAKLTLQERRIETLRQQLKGKTLVIPTRENRSQQVDYSKTFTLESSPMRENSHETAAVSATYLRNDLLKIVTLTALAIGTQVALFFASKNNLVNLSYLHFS